MVLSLGVRRKVMRSGFTSRLSIHPPLTYRKKKRPFYRLRETSVMQELPVQRLMLKEKEYKAPRCGVTLLQAKINNH